MRTPRLRRAVLGGALAVLLVATGCAAPARAVTVTVLPEGVRADEPVSVRVTGLRAAETVALTLHSVDARGEAWDASAVFVADADGTVDPGATAPTSGSYSGVDAMGLISSLSPTPPDPTGRTAYSWPAVGASDFDAAVVRDGRTIASARAERIFWTGRPTITTLTLDHDGFVGTYFRPAGVQRGPAVLALGGSEGGDPRIDGAIFAARGIPTLTVAYFGAPGLPSRLSRISLKYFDAPLRWLRSQPEVDPDRLWVLGASRGSEAAALVAADRPTQVHGLLDLVPSATAGCSYDPAGQVPCPGPAWTRDGKPVAHTLGLNSSDATPDSAAVIRVERINGPVLTSCGGADLVWASCRFGEEIQARLKAQGFAHPTLALAYPYAGHGVGLPMPYYPAPPLAAHALPTYGSSPLANDEARADAWPKILSFIAAQG